MKPVGYLTNYKEGPAGEPGLYYNYTLAANGLFLDAENPLLKVSIPVAYAEVRGLQLRTPVVHLKNGRIPKYLYDLALSVLYVDRYNERYAAIIWENGYRVRDTSFDTGEAHVSYHNLPSTIMDIHSHGFMRGWFSSMDTSDEQGLRLSMVVGELDKLIPDVSIRLCVYGYYYDVTFDEVFNV